MAGIGGTHGSAGAPMGFADFAALAERVLNGAGLRLVGVECDDMPGFIVTIEGPDADTIAEAMATRVPSGFVEHGFRTAMTFGRTTNRITLRMQQ
jgi:hypothetical protein